MGSQNDTATEIVQCSLSLQKSNVVKEKAPEFNMIGLLTYEYIDTNARLNGERSPLSALTDSYSSLFHCSIQVDSTSGCNGKTASRCAQSQTGLRNEISDVKQYANCTPVTDERMDLRLKRTTHV